MSWIQTAYLIAEIIAIPLTGWLTRADAAMAVRIAIASLPLPPSAARSAQFYVLVSFRVFQGFAGGTDSGGFFRCFFAVSGPFASRCHHHGRHNGRAGAHGRAGGRWLDHRHLVLALAVSDQCLPGVVAALDANAVAERPRLSDLAYTRCRARAACGFACCLEIGLKEARNAGGRALPSLLCSFVSAAAGFVVRTLWSAQPVAELGTFRDRIFDRLSAKFSIWNWIVRIGLSDAGFSRICERPQCI